MQDKASGKRPAVFERLAFSLNEQCLQFIIAHCKYNNVYRDKRLFKSCFLRILNHSVGRTTRYLNVLREISSLMLIGSTRTMIFKNIDSWFHHAQGRVSKLDNNLVSSIKRAFIQCITC